MGANAGPPRSNLCPATVSLRGACMVATYSTGQARQVSGRERRVRSNRHHHHRHCHRRRHHRHRRLSIVIVAIGQQRHHRRHRHRHRHRRHRLPSPVTIIIIIVAIVIVVIVVAIVVVHVAITSQRLQAPAKRAVPRDVARARRGGRVDVRFNAPLPLARGRSRRPADCVALAEFAALAVRGPAPLLGRADFKPHVWLLLVACRAGGAPQSWPRNSCKGLRARHCAMSCSRSCSSMGTLTAAAPLGVGDAVAQHPCRG